ncbi:MAG: hypothetical protein ACR2LJ_04835 [Acidimicrobiales bacterium]
MKIPLESVAYREGAVPRPDMVSVVDETATKENAKPPGPTGDAAGLELETKLSVQAWVRNVDPTKYSWVDLHVFDENDQLIRAETLALDWLEAAGDDGDIFAFEGSIYRGTGAVGGSVWFGEDARKLQYRLYYEVNGTVFSDGVLRQHEVTADAEVMNPSHSTAKPRRTAKAPSSGIKVASKSAPAESGPERPSTAKRSTAKRSVAKRSVAKPSAAKPSAVEPSPAKPARRAG